VEMMSGAVWVRDRLAAAGWEVQVAHAGKVRDVAPLACKTDKVDARVLAELCRRDLVPELWVPALADRELRERFRRRMHLVGVRASAMNRIFGLLTQWGLRLSLEAVARTRRDDAARATRRPPCRRQDRGRCAGPPSRPPNTPGDPPTPGTSSTPTSPNAPARTPPNPPSPARSSSPLGTSCPASSRSSPPRHAGPNLPRQAPAAFWPPDGPACN
jgi:hypothetical protein